MRSSIQRWLGIASLAAMIGLPLASRTAQANWTLDEALKQLDRETADFRSLSADVERTKVTVVVNDRSTESGKILVRRDDKMRIDLTQPDARTILDRKSTRLNSSHS